MKVLISVDLEGVTGSTAWSSTNLGDYEYGPVAKQMKEEALAAALGAVDAGADTIVIKDAHDSGRNIDITGFPKQCRFVRGWINGPESMIDTIDESYDAVLYVGYHSPAGSDANPLSHTMNLDNVYVKYNDQLCSEFLMHAYYAQELGIPSVFISGDQGICDHARSHVPGITTVAVKEGVGNATVNITPEEACERIRAGAKEGILRRKECMFQLPETLTMEIRFKNHYRAKHAAYYPGVVQIDPYTVQYTGKTVKEVSTCRMFIL